MSRCLTLRCALFLTLLGGSLLSACSAGQTAAPTESGNTNPEVETNSEKDLAVFAAASLAEAFDEIISQFEAAHPGVKVSANYAGSQQLAQQLAQGAPADIFASANLQQMNAAVQSERITGQNVRPFAENRLVAIFYSARQDETFSLEDLAKPGMKLVLADRSVPAGQYALEFLERATAQSGLSVDFKQRVLNNVSSYEENVRAVLAKVSLGEADAGIVYQTDLLNIPSSQVKIVEIPDALNVKAVYLIAPVTDSQHPALASELVDFILSQTGQEILSRHGFRPAE